MLTDKMADELVLGYVLGAVTKHLPSNARQRIGNGESEQVLNETVGGALLSFLDFAARLQEDESTCSA